MSIPYRDRIEVPLPVVQEDRLHELRRTLEGHAYDEASITFEFGLATFHDLFSEELCAPSPTSALGTLVDCFGVGRQVAAGSLSKLLGRNLFCDLLEGNLLWRNGVYAGSRFLIHPHRGLMLVSDSAKHRYSLDQVMRPSRQTSLLSEALPESISGIHIDVGCGTGCHALLMAARGCSSIGIDNNRRAVELSRLNAALNGLKVCFEATSLECFFSKSKPCGLITAHPPYSPESRVEAGCSYWAGGQNGDELSALVLRTCAPRLTAGGRLIMVTVLPVPSWEEVETWVNDKLPPRFLSRVSAQPIDYESLSRRTMPAASFIEAKRLWRSCGVVGFSQAIIDVERI